MRGHVRRRCSCPTIDGPKGRRKVCPPSCKAPYAVVIDLGPDASGKRRQKWHSGYRTKRDAEGALAELVGSVNKGAYVAPARQTVADYLTVDWLPAVRGTLRASTYDSYARNIRLHVIPHIGGLQLQQLDGPILNRWYHAMGAGETRKELSKRSVAYIATIVHRALADAVRWNRLLANPADRSDPPRVRMADRAARPTWTAAQLAQALAALEDDRLAALWFLYATTGMRRGEALGLRWRSVDLEAGTASIHETLVTTGVRHEGDQGFGWETPKTAKGRRSVALDPRTVAALRGHRVRQAQERLLAGPGYDDQDLVFAEVDGRPLHPKSISETWNSRVRTLGLPHLSLHGLRHTYCTLALEAAVHPRVVQERVGHASVSITLDLYSHVNPAMQADAADKVANVIFGSVS